MSLPFMHFRSLENQIFKRTSAKQSQLLMHMWDLNLKLASCKSKCQCFQQLICLYTFQKLLSFNSALYIHILIYILFHADFSFGMSCQRWQNMARLGDDATVISFDHLWLFAMVPPHLYDRKSDLPYELIYFKWRFYYIAIECNQSQ